MTIPDPLNDQTKNDLIRAAESLDYGQQLELISLAHAVHDERISWHRFYRPDRGVYVILPVDPFVIFRDRHGQERGWVRFVKGAFAAALILSLVIASLGTLMGVPMYFNASRSAEIYNRLNATNYTTWDFFWAGDQINASTHTLRLK